MFHKNLQQLVAIRRQSYSTFYYFNDRICFKGIKLLFYLIRIGPLVDFYPGACSVSAQFSCDYVFLMQGERGS